MSLCKIFALAGLLLWVDQVQSADLSLAGAYRGLISTKASNSQRDLYEGYGMNMSLGLGKKTSWVLGYGYTKLLSNYETVSPGDYVENSFSIHRRILLSASGVYASLGMEYQQLKATGGASTSLLGPTLGLGLMLLGKSSGIFINSQFSYTSFLSSDLSNARNLSISSGLRLRF